MAVLTTLFKGAYSAKKTTPEGMLLPEITVEDVLDAAARDKVVSETMEDFQRRRDARQPFELRWRQIQNFIAGNQWIDIDFEMNRLFGSSTGAPKDVYNKMAPIYETRVAKLSNIRPLPITRPATKEEISVLQSQLTTQLLNATYNQVNLREKIASAVMWSELTGTAFYKVAWNPFKGRLLGMSEIIRDDGTVISEPVYEGGPETIVVNPFEIYPDYVTNENISDMRSIIHAQALPLEVVNDAWNVNLSPEPTWVEEVIGADVMDSAFSIYSIGQTDQMLTVIEKFEVPTKAYPYGRHIIVANNTLLHYAALPFMIGEDGRPGLPFVKQVSIRVPGVFWGRSIHERLIPIQRQYNNVRSDITNIISRYSYGTIEAVEGAYDKADLEDGLLAGRVIYRKPGQERLTVVEMPEIPNSLTQEVSRLENDFTSISGVSEYAVYGESGANASGVQLDMLTKSDDSRIRPTGDSIRNAIITIAKMWIRLYRQFATGLRVARAVGDDNTATIAVWEASDLTTDDVVLDTTTDLQQSPAERKQAIIELLQYQLFVNPKTGKIDDAIRQRILKEFELLDNSPTTSTEQVSLQRAQNENFAMREGIRPFVKMDDNDDVHIDEHVKFELSQDIDALVEQNPDLYKWVLFHIEEHRQNKLKKLQREIEDQAQMAALQQSAMPQMPAQGQQQ